MRFILSLLLILSSISGFSQKNQLPYFDEITVDSSNLPITFDLRKTNSLSPVKTQPNGGCWASASNVTLESWLRYSGSGDFVFSDINLQLFNKFEEERNVNGNHLMATAYYSRLSGPVEKKQDLDSVSFVKAPLPYIVTDARFLPNDSKLIKQTIKNFGAVYSMMHFKKEETDSITLVYYTEKENINHVVSLVGWNDTLASNKGRGCWIAQNSLGIKFGEEGFFYIPYQDKNIIKHNAVWTNWISGNSNYDLYYIDTLGSYNGYGFDDTVCYGMVEYSAKQDGNLNKIASWIGEDSTRIKIEIYRSFNKETRVLNDLLITEESQLCRFAGYYTFDLSNPIHFDQGENFYVVIRYTHSNSKQPMPVEQFIKDYADPHISTGRCWINPNYEKWPNTWYEIGMESDYDFLSFDLNIRVSFLND